MKLTTFFISKSRQDYTKPLTGSERATEQKMKKSLMENSIFCAVSNKNKGDVTSKYFANFANVKFYGKIKTFDYYACGLQIY